MILLLVFAVVVISVTPGQAQLTNGLVAYWPLDGNANDQQGTVDLTAQQNATFDNLTSLVGSAAGTSGNEEFGQNSGFFSLDPVGSVLNLTNEITVSSWYRIDSLGSTGEKSAALHRSRVFGWYNPDDNSNYHYALSWTDTGGTDHAFTSPALSIGTNVAEWYHVVERVDSVGNLTFWHQNQFSDDHSSPVRNTVLSNYQRIDTSLLTSSGGLEFVTAYYEGKGGSTGNVSADELAIWNRALSDQEIETLFDNGKAGIPIAAEPVTRFAWKKTDLGSWNLSSNWDLADSPNSAEHTALFGSPASIIGRTTVVTNTPVTVNRLEFDNALHSYFIAGGGSVELAQHPGDGSPLDPTIELTNGNHEIQVKVNLAGDTTVTANSDTTLDFNNEIALGGSNFDIAGLGTVNLNHSTTGSGTVNNSGTLGTAGSTNLSFDLNNTGTLRFDLGPNNVDSFDVLGNVDLAGILDVRLEPDYAPDPGQQFVVLTAGHLIDRGLALTTTAQQMFNINVDVTNDEVVLTAIGSDGVTGDYNNNGIVDAADYTVWRDNQGTTHLLPNRDPSHSGAIGQDDYISWKTNFGNTGGNAAAIPEPASLLLLTYSCFCVTVFNRTWLRILRGTPVIRPRSSRVRIDVVHGKSMRTSSRMT